MNDIAALKTGLVTEAEADAILAEREMVVADFGGLSVVGGDEDETGEAA